MLAKITFNYVRQQTLTHDNYKLGLNLLSTMDITVKNVFFHLEICDQSKQKKVDNFIQSNFTCKQNPVLKCVCQSSTATLCQVISIFCVHTL